MNAIVNAGAVAQSMDMDDLLDATIDALADAPEFKPFPAGAHRVTLKTEFADVGDWKNVPKVSLTAIETVELADPNKDQPLKEKDSTSVSYVFKKKNKDTGAIEPNEFAQGQFKELIGALKAGGVPGETNREIFEAANGLEVLAVTKIRRDTRDKNNIKEYTAIDSVQVL